MKLELRVYDVRKAMRENKPKEVVECKYEKYLEEYDETDKTVLDKQRHRDLFFDYLRYVNSSGVKK